MKKCEEIIQAQSVYLIYNELSTISDVYKDKIDLESYKNNKLELLSDERILEMEVLMLLEKLGYPMNQIGTYLYKNMIIKIIYSLNGNLSDEYISELLGQILNHYSQFYLDLARNDLDIGIKTFHSIVKNSILNIDYSKCDKKLIYEIFGNNNLNYDEQAFILGNYVSLSLKKVEFQKVKNNQGY